MRVLLASDLSRSAAVAAQLAAGLSWPKNTTILVLGVIEHARPVGSVARVSGEERTAVEFTAGIRKAGERLATPGLTIETRTQFGRAADVIVQAASWFRADLVIMGSRGRGLVRSALLGSVSAEVVERAPCPVLIARRSQISGIVFCADADTRTAEAADVLRWPLFADVPIWVVGAASVALPGGHSAFMRSRHMSRVHRGLAIPEGLEAAAERVTQREVTDLVALGRTATYEVRVGSRASALLAAADEFRADLIIVGSGGRSDLKRLFLGSTARAVLYQASCSVLIAPQQAPVEFDELGSLALNYAS